MQQLNLPVREVQGVFEDDLARELTKILPEHIKPQINGYVKNNASLRTGVSFTPDDSRLSDEMPGFTPIIYVDLYREPYERGELSAGDIAALVSEEYMRYLSYPLKEPDFLDSFERARLRLAFKIKNTSKNEEFLKDIPHVDILDLSLVFFYLVDTDEHGVLSCTITNEMMEDWGVDTDTLFETAMLNTPRFLPPRLRPLRELIDFPVADDSYDEERDIYVLTNMIGANGASVLFYKDFLKSCCDTLNDDIYILPSSVHELIVLRASLASDKETLARIVSEVNSSTVSPEDYLSDSVYFVSRDIGILEYA